MFEFETKTDCDFGSDFPFLTPKQISLFTTISRKKVKGQDKICFTVNPTLRAVGGLRQKHQSLFLTSQPFPPNHSESSDYLLR